MKTRLYWHIATLLCVGALVAAGCESNTGDSGKTPIDQGEDRDAEKDSDPASREDGDDPAPDTSSGDDAPSDAEQDSSSDTDADSAISCNFDDAEHTGSSTFYAADGTGACSFPASSSDLKVVALNPQDFAGSAACGACVSVDGPDGSVTARVVDLCPGCSEGDIDLSAEAFAEIADPNAGRVSVSWRFVACEVDGPLRYHFKDGSNPWWTAVQVRNHRYPIGTVEIRGDGEGFQTASRSSYNYFIVDGGMGAGPYDFRVTDTLGHVVEDSDIEFAADTVADGSAQFPECVD